ncbi:hypothetical protein [Leifsonia aquatica]|uniref:hypothetical protein n=1 Tax=Leifsonia aquatica TaxID=144185 RepID=UPI0038124F9A
MAIKLDESSTSVVVYCTDCGHWRAFAWTLSEGHDAAVRHEQLVHPDLEQADQARRRYLRRHADDSSIVTVDDPASSAWESSIASA